MSASNTSPTPYVRLATPEELPIISGLVYRAFLEDPVWNYFGSLQSLLTKDTSESPRGRRNLQRFCRFLPRMAYLLGGRITVVVVPKAVAESGPNTKEEENSEGGLKKLETTPASSEEIGAMALWLAPHQRIATWKVITLIRSGIVPVLTGWRWNGFKRITMEYSDATESAFKTGLKAKGLRETPHDTWYLQLVATDPMHQGKGLMSLLVREAFAHAPSSTFTLDATTPRSSAQYAHLGFEMLQQVTLGKGKVGLDGLPASGADAVGVPLFCMVKIARKNAEVDEAPK